MQYAHHVGANLIKSRDRLSDHLLVLCHGNFFPLLFVGLKLGLEV
jgi:hypothetical protein